MKLFENAWSKAVIQGAMDWVSYVLYALASGPLLEVSWNLSMPTLCMQHVEYLCAVGFVGRPLVIRGAITGPVCVGLDRSGNAREQCLSLPSGVSHQQRLN